MSKRKSTFSKIVLAVLVLLTIDFALFYNNSSVSQQTITNQILDTNIGHQVHKYYDQNNNKVDEVVEVINDNKDLLELYDVSNPRNRRLRSFLHSDLYDELRPELVDKLKSKNKNFGKFDKRLLPAFYLNLINKNLDINSNNTSILPEDFKLPFNWNLVTNTAQEIRNNLYFEKIIANKSTCQEFHDLSPENQPENFSEYCLDYNYTDPNYKHNDYKLPFRIVKKLDEHLTDVHWRRLYSQMYILDNFPIPDNAIFMGGIGQSEMKSLLVPLKKVTNGKNDITKITSQDDKLKNYYNKLSEDYINDRLDEFKSLKREDVLANGISLYQEYIKLNQKLEYSGLKEKLFENSIAEPIYKPNKPMILGRKISFLPESSIVELEPKIFDWYLPDELKKLEVEISNAKEGDDVSQLKHLVQCAKNIANEKYEEPWYYGIPRVETEELTHYDWRFFNEYTVKENGELHTAVLHRLARVWYRMCQEFGMASWLNHGPLIGWYWNGVSMPYDFDLDLQMPIQHLHKMAKFLNNTILFDLSNEPEYINDDVKIDNKAEFGYRSYFIDIDPIYWDRQMLRSIENKIDARLIDTETGIYIDITALSDLHGGNDFNFEKELEYIKSPQTKTLKNRMFAPIYMDQYRDEDGAYVKNDATSESIQTNLIERYETYMKNNPGKDTLAPDSPARELDGIIHDKHYHTYKVSEISPLVPIYFEGTLCYIPGNWHRNIAIEYGIKATHETYFHKNKFLKDLMLWVNYEECPSFWDKETGKPLSEDESENDVAMNCLNYNKKIEKDFKTNHFYSIMHSFFREKIEPRLDSKFKPNYDNYQTELFPILQKIPGNIMRAEPWVSENLFT
ncbi:hypothetical protein PACTADRAFT_49543 [Pachysolen tannophilus NRRL Y-2460]|uniref:LicD/FKTN/FKRP nucleotidyltransferase domain-containing protein n=1 Tax=Pachysolen tannophilus NRRL Y-2460 TaxID=669874 RepID=A0A1E4TWN1_PACTA|nr:hypothetical protein PACTADRAFT_49543 [Pachysolen tannophilus NRRL Y-2460]